MSDIDDPNERPKSAVATLLTWVAGFVILGVVAAVVLPSFMRPKPYRQPEAKSNLKAAYTAQKSYMQEKDLYDTRTGTIGFSPERGNRYTYFLAERGVIEHRDQKESKPEPEAVIIAADRFKHPRAARFASFRDTGCPIAACPAPDGTILKAPGVHNDKQDSANAAFLMAAVGNFDDDDTLDCWSTCSHERVAADGSRIPAGEPHVDQSDLN